MKKILCLLLSLMLFTSAVASAAGLEFLNDASMMRYTSSNTMTLTMDAPKALIEEVLAFAEGSYIENYVDLDVLLADLMSGEQDVETQVIISEDFKHIQLGMQAENRQSIQINANANVNLNTKSGLWLDMDLTDAANPVYKMIYSSPAANKYIVLDIIPMMQEYASEEECAEMLRILNLVFNKSFMEPLMEQSRTLLEKHATVKLSGKTCTIHMSSQQFSAYVADVINITIDSMALLGSITPEEADQAKLAVLTYAPQISLLGENGFTATYSLTSKKMIQKGVAEADFEICIKDIVNLFDPSGESWPIENDGTLKLHYEEEMKIKLRGEGVKVAYPELTEENSVSYADYFGLTLPSAEPDYGYEDYAPELPYYYASAYAEQLPVIDGVIYVPLRALLDDAYAGEIAIDFAADETITITSKHFDTVQIKIGESYANVNGEAIWVDPVKLLGDTTYVSQAFFENVFGWVLGTAEYNIPHDYYYCSFYTSQW